MVQQCFARSADEAGHVQAEGLGMAGRSGVIIYGVQSWSWHLEGVRECDTTSS